MHVLIACKNEEDPSKNEGARVFTTFPSFFRRSREANSAVRGRIWPKLELIQAFIVARLTCKNEEDPLKNESARAQHYTSKFQMLKGR